MGRAARARPRRLPGKLLQIREEFGVSQEELLELLGIEREVKRHYISGFETGEREPSMPILLRYARLAGVCLDVLVDDQLDLPDGIPSIPQHQLAANRRPRKRS
jgi:transcriptional regulator with XRE-family HTH domain